MATARLRLGQLLVDARMVTQEALDKTLELQRSDGRRLGMLLVEQGLINETQLTQILSHQLAVPWVSLLHIEFSRQLLNLVPHDTAERYCLVPIYVRHVRNQGETLYVAMDDPTNEDGIKECTAYSGLPVRAMIAPPSDIRNAIRVYYGARSRSVPPVAPSSQVPSIEPVSTHSAEPRAASERPPAPRSEVPLIGVDIPVPGSIRPPPVARIRPEDDALPAIETREVDAADLAFVEEIEAWEGARAPVHEERARSEPPRPMAKVAPASLERLAAAQQESIGPTPSKPAAALLGAVLGRAGPMRSATPYPGEEPPSEREVQEIPAPPGRSRRRMVSLTLLDGTTITLPARGSKAAKAAPATAAAAVSSRSAPNSEPPPTVDDSGLTARDLVSALRAVSHGADASEILGNNVRWEAMFAAMLSLLLKKHLIADWEFVDELKKI